MTVMYLGTGRQPVNWTDYNIVH